MMRYYLNVHFQGQRVKSKFTFSTVPFNTVKTSRFQLVRRYRMHGVIHLVSSYAFMAHADLSLLLLLFFYAVLWATVLLGLIPFCCMSQCICMGRKLKKHLSILRTICLRRYLCDKKNLLIYKWTVCITKVYRYYSLCAAASSFRS